MKNRRQFLVAGGGLAALAALTQWRAFGAGPMTKTGAMAASGQPAERFAVQYTDAQWKARLTPIQYQILREEGTERPYTSPLNDEHRPGVFACAGCGTKAFSSKTKFDSHTGWPSFYEPIPNAVAMHIDTSYGMERKEVHCAHCGGHLGHVFDDGPPPTGLRYCMNGYAMTFAPGSA